MQAVCGHPENLFYAIGHFTETKLTELSSHLSHTK